MILPAPAAGIGSPGSAAVRTPQQGHAAGVPLYNLHNHFETTITPQRATKLEAAGLVRSVRSRGQVVRAYQTTIPGENFEEWRPRVSGGAIVLQSRRIVGAGR